VKIHKILCPVDFSDYSQRALRHAFAIARRNHSELTVLHVEDVLLAAARAEARLHAPFIGSAESELRTFVDETERSAVGNVKPVIQSGHAVDCIIEQARRDSTDLIVIGTRGRSGLARAVLGSVAERVLTEARCAVLTVPPAAQGAAMEDLVPFDPILCASDFSASCRKALSLALSMAQESNARLILLHALQVPVSDLGLMPLQPIIVDPIDRTEWRRLALARLQAGLPYGAKSRCRPETLVTTGRPAETIVRVAQEEHVGVVVMGVHSRGAIDRMLFGSTSREVIHSVRCPVLSIRADKHDPVWVSTPDEAQLAVGA
jgi:nucleotide-binding universal stress UspA family protein